MKIQNIETKKSPTFSAGTIISEGVGGIDHLVGAKVNALMQAAPNGSELRFIDKSTKFDPGAIEVGFFPLTGGKSSVSVSGLRQKLTVADILDIISLGKIKLGKAKNS